MKLLSSRSTRVALLTVLAAARLAAQQAGDPTQRAMEMAARGDADGAYEILNPWVDAHPDDVGARTALAAVAAQTGRLDEAEELLEGLPADDPRLALLGADLALGRGEGRVAIGRLVELWPVRPPELDREFRRVLGQAYVETGQPLLALEVLAVVESDPELVLWKSRALFQVGRFEEAVAELAPLAEQIRALRVENAPESQRFLMAEILIDFARGLMATGRATEAVDLLEPRVVGLGSSRGWKLLAQALVASGRGDEARAVLNRGAALTKDK